jgi:hypothetical protein
MYFGKKVKLTGPILPAKMVLSSENARFWNENPEATAT